MSYVRSILLGLLKIDSVTDSRITEDGSQVKKTHHGCFTDQKGLVKNFSLPVRPLETSGEKGYTTELIL